MVQFFFENIEEITIPPLTKDWLYQIIISEHKKIGEINYIFCDDEHLLQVNQDF